MTKQQAEQQETRLQRIIDKQDQLIQEQESMIKLLKSIIKDFVHA